MVFLRGSCIRRSRSYMLEMQRFAAGLKDRSPLGVSMTQSRTIVLTSGSPAAAQPQSAERAELTGCPWHDVKAMLRQVGLRPTRQRMALGWLLFGKGDRHLTAEMLYEEATRAK